MTWRDVVDGYELLDDPAVNGERVIKWLRGAGRVVDARCVTIGDGSNETDFVSVTVPGKSGRLAGGPSPTLGIIGRLGGLGARPARIGFVSDGDGALAVLAAGAKLARMNDRGDQLDGDVIVSTHICAHAPTRPHLPVAFMDSPVSLEEMNRQEVNSHMNAILSVDTTKGNRLCNHRGFAISPTVREGWILRVSDDLLDIAEAVSGRLCAVLPLTMQDITPYGTDIYHLNSILQPSTATDVPVVGVGITAETVVAGSATGASDLVSVESAARFCVEVAKGYTAGSCMFSDEEEFARLRTLYGSMSTLQGA